MLFVGCRRDQGSKAFVSVSRRPPASTADTYMRPCTAPARVNIADASRPLAAAASFPNAISEVFTPFVTTRPALERTTGSRACPWPVPVAGPSCGELSIGLDQAEMRPERVNGVVAGTPNQEFACIPRDGIRLV